MASAACAGAAHAVVLMLRPDLILASPASVSFAARVADGGGVMVLTDGCVRAGIGVLLLRRFSGGCSISFARDSPAEVRYVARCVAELVGMLELVVVGVDVLASDGEFRRPRVRGSYVLVAGPKTVIPDMRDDLGVVAADLGACHTATLGRWGNCRNLALIRFPSALTMIRDEGFSGCDSLVEVDLRSCPQLGRIGQGAFRATGCLSRLTLAPSLASLWIGHRAFVWSGVRVFDGWGCVVSLGVAVFEGCRVLQRVRFEVASFAQHVFSACWAPDLRVSLSRVGYIEQNSLDCSSAVVDLPGEGGAVSRAVARAVLRQRADAEVGFDAEAPLLSVCPLRGAFLSDDERRHVRVVDLTKVGGLPRAFHLRDCEWMREVRLPLWMTSIPGSFFKGCRRLVQINLEQCVGLRSVGEAAFEGCLSLGRVSLPPEVSSLDWGWSGLVELDLRGLRALRKVRLQPCNLLERLIMPTFGEVDVVLGPCPWLRELSIGCFDRGDRRRCFAVRAALLRFTSQNGRWTSGLMTAASRAAVFAEVVALAGREGCPIFPS